MSVFFAYGQTGSGKTHSMMGESTAHLLKGEELIESDGLIPRVCAAIFVRKAKLESADVKWEVRASYVEVYNELVKDLLADKKGSVEEEWLDVRQQKDGSFFLIRTRCCYRKTRLCKKNKVNSKSCSST